jgi:hypothetical protein
MSVNDQAAHDETIVRISIGVRSTDCMDILAYG